MEDKKNNLKSCFEEYDNQKTEFYKNLIENWEKNHKYNVEYRFKSKEEMFKYVKILEKDINIYRKSFKEFEEVILKMQIEVEKLKTKEIEYLKEIEKVELKLKLAEDYNN